MNRIITLVALILATTNLSALDTISFSTMYYFNVLGMDFTPEFKALQGKEVAITGWMAPPLKVKDNFFVLTKDPVSLCPFCQSDADWPADIIVVYLRTDEVFIQKNRPLLVRGTLELGSRTDPDTGFVSQVRISNAHYEVAP